MIKTKVKAPEIRDWNILPKRYDENLISELDITPKVCICILPPPKPINIDVIISLIVIEAFVAAILFAPVVTSKIPAIIPLDTSIGKVGIKNFAIKLVIYSFSKIVEISENNIINPPITQTTLTEFFMMLLKIEPNSLIFIILNSNFGLELFLLLFLKTPNKKPTNIAER